MPRLLQIRLRRLPLVKSGGRAMTEWPDYGRTARVLRVIMRVLVVGAGVVGTVYGAHLAAAGNTVWVLSHGPRTGEVAAGGLCARDVLGGGRADAETAVVADASGGYDIVVVAVRRDQLASACAELSVLAGKPAIVFF